MFHDDRQKRLAILFELRGADAMDHRHLAARLRLEVHHVEQCLVGEDNIGGNLLFGCKRAPDRFQSFEQSCIPLR